MSSGKLSILLIKKIGLVLSGIFLLLGLYLNLDPLVWVSGGELIKISASPFGRWEVKEYYAGLGGAISSSSDYGRAEIVDLTGRLPTRNISYWHNSEQNTIEWRGRNKLVYNAENIDPLTYREY